MSPDRWSGPNKPNACLISMAFVSEGAMRPTWVSRLSCDSWCNWSNGASDDYISLSTVWTDVIMNDNTLSHKHIRTHTHIHAQMDIQKVKQSLHGHFYTHFYTNPHLHRETHTHTQALKYKDKGLALHRKQPRTNTHTRTQTQRKDTPLMFLPRPCVSSDDDSALA